MTTATGKVFTYYFPDGRVEVREGELEPEGAVWIDGEYRPPVYPSAVNVRVGRHGVPVVTVIAYLKAADGDPVAVLDQWRPLLDSNDIELARWFYQHDEQDRREIDASMREDTEIG